MFGEGDPDMAQLLLRRREEQPQQSAVASAGAGAGAPAVAAGADGDAAMSEASGSGRGEEAGGEKEGGGGPAAESRLLTQPGGQWGCWARVAKAHGADVNCVRWSPAEPRLLASCSDDGLIRLWWLR